MSTPRGLSARRLLAGLVTLVALVCAAGPAAAHSELERSVPAQGEVVGAPLGHVQLVFASGLSDGLTQVVVNGPDGTDLAAGAPQVNGSTVTQPLRPATGAGPYRVAYRVVADDGHPITGTVEFTGTAPAPAPAGTPAAPAAPEPAPEGAPTPASAAGSGASGAPDEDGGPAAGAWVLGGLAALGVGALLAARRSSAARRAASA